MCVNYAKIEGRMRRNKNYNSNAGIFKAWDKYVDTGGWRHRNNVEEKLLKYLFDQKNRAFFSIN